MLSALRAGDTAIEAGGHPRIAARFYYRAVYVAAGLSVLDPSHFRDVLMAALLKWSEMMVLSGSGETSYEFVHRTSEQMLEQVEHPGRKEVFARVLRRLRGAGAGAEQEEPAVDIPVLGAVYTFRPVAPAAHGQGAAAVSAGAAVYHAVLDVIERLLDAGAECGNLEDTRMCYADARIIIKALGRGRYDPLRTCVALRLAEAHLLLDDSVSATLVLLEELEALAHDDGRGRRISDASAALLHSACHYTLGLCYEAQGMHWPMWREMGAAAAVLGTAGFLELRRIVLHRCACRLEDIVRARCGAASGHGGGHEGRSTAAALLRAARDLRAMAVDAAGKPPCPDIPVMVHIGPCYAHEVAFL